MNHTRTVAKNSFWLILQPLLLNVISIFAVGYIARMLGNEDYGKFIFVFSLIGMFIPFTSLGLGSITIRTIAANREHAGEFIGKILPLRICLSFISIVLIVCGINILHYPLSTKIVTYIASVIVLFQAMTATLQDGFMAFEKMEYVAVNNFISGFILTIFSVAILFWGYRLIGLTLVYSLGSMLGLGVAVGIFLKYISSINIRIDFKFWKTCILKGSPFFFPAFVYLASDKIGLIFLSKISGNVAVGEYGAAYGLIEKLSIIPTAICSSAFPTISALFKESREETGKLFKKFFLYSILIGLPLAISITVLAKPIIHIIYGNRYEGSIFILQLISWGLFLTFLYLLEGYTLGAIHQEKRAAVASYVSAGLYLLFFVLFVPYMSSIGLALAGVMGSFSMFIYNFFLIRTHLCQELISFASFCRIILVNVLFLFYLLIFQNLPLIFVIPTSILFYGVVIILSKIISISELKILIRLIKPK